MRRLFAVPFMLGALLCFASEAAAQIIRIPKIPKVTTTAPATDPAPASSDTRPSTTAAAVSTRGGGPYTTRPVPPETPMLMAETLEVDIERWDYHWKVPNDNHNTSWMPRLRFNIFYGGTAKLRLKAEYTMPDGTLWFSEALEHRGTTDSTSGASMIASDSGSDRDKKAIVTGGTFGLKITNMRDNSVLFDGKFKVVRYKPKYSDARYKNEVDYYTDYDWKIPMAVAELAYSRDFATPNIRMFFKGDRDTKNFEARIYKDGKELATTDDGGVVTTGNSLYAWKRGDDDSLYWDEFVFSWPYRIEFLMTEDGRSFTSYANTKFLNQAPGEYVVKVFYDGEQIRETSFTVGPNANIADNGYAGRIGVTTNKVFLPVKVMGTVDKWNAANAKALGFYGKPMP